MATWFRNSEIKDDVVYVGPMGCLTGMYIIMKGIYSVRDMRSLMLRCIDWILSQEKVPATEPETCGNYLLQDRRDVLRVFIHAPLEARRDRVADFSLAWSEKEVLRHIRTEDKRRAAYYRYYTGEEWRDAAGYDLCLDSEVLGEDGCVERILKVLPLYCQD